MWASSNHIPIVAQRRQHGFTIVELLIVIVVIGILAAITIVAFNGVQKKAQASAAQSAVSQANKKIVTYAVQNSDMYPADLTSAGISDTSGLEYSYDNGSSPKTYGITATIGTSSYYVSNTTAQPTVGGYQGHGRGGVASIRNIVTNPSAEAGLAGIVGSAAVMSTDTSWAASGSTSFRITPNSASNDSHFGLGGDMNGGFRAGLEAGKTYTVSGTVRIAAPLTGSVRAQSRTIVAFYTTSAGAIVATQSPQSPNTAGASRLNVTFSIPETATSAWIRFYAGTTTGSGDVWWDALMINEGSDLFGYGDGATSGWAWLGVPQASASSGPRS